MLLGMSMSQLVNPFKYNVYTNFWASSGPVKEVLLDYAEKEWKGAPHTGETPPQIADDVVRRGQLAVQAIEKAAKSVKTNADEFARMKNDVYCYNAFAGCFAEKVRAAMLILRYQYSNDLTDFEKAIPMIEKSVQYYTELVKLTDNSYLYANSMQTAQRRIPFSGANGTNKTWKELLPKYQAELDNLKRNVAMLKNKSNVSEIQKKNIVFVPAKVEILNNDVTIIPLQKDQLVYADKDFKIEKVAEELQNLKAVQFNNRQQQDKGTVLKFRNELPVKVLVGYFNGNSYSILSPPTLETNAQANDRGQADIRIANALLIPRLYPVNVYSYSYPAGNNELTLGKGQVLVLGFIDGNQDIVTTDAGLAETGIKAPIDWIFY